MLVCGRVVGSELSHCNPLLVVCSSPLVVAHDLRVVVVVWAVGGEIDGFLSIVSHLFDLGMTSRYHDSLLSPCLGPSI